MKKFKKAVLAIFLSTAMTISGAANATDIVIGVPNWSTVKMTAHLLKTVIEDNFGLDVELQTASNPVIFEAMERGSMHIHPEVWLPNQANLHNTYVKERKTVRKVSAGVESFQGMCTTKASAEATGLKKITDLSDPDMAAQFDTNGDGKGEVYIGGPGWASTIVERIRAKSYGYDETLELQEIDEAVAHGNLDNAVAAGKNWVGYCYTPHHMFNVHELYILEEPAYDAAKWKVIQPTDDPNWLEKSDAGVAWDSAYLHIHYAAALEKSHPEVAAMLSKVNMTTDQVSGMAFADAVEGKDPDAYADEFIAENAALVASWLK